MRIIDYIVLHCTGGPQTQTVKTIRDYWKKVLGWKTPGYHHLITPDGVDHNLVPIEKISNGVAGKNANIINISYVGGVSYEKVKNGKGVIINVIGQSVDNRTPEQLATMERLVRKYHKQFPKAKTVGHRDLSPDKNNDGVISKSEWVKACPGFDVATWLIAIKLN